MLQFIKRQPCAPLLVAIMCAITVVSSQVTSCLPPNAVSPVQKAQPAIPNSMRVKVEMKDEGRNHTRQLELIVDGNGNRALLTDMDNGTLTTIHFLYLTQEIIYIKGRECTVKNLNVDPGRFVLFGNPAKDGLEHIPDGATALYFGQSIAKVYKGTKMVRGIWCDWWHTCIRAPFDLHQNLSIDYYFSVSTWTTPSLFSPVPVRYEVTDTRAFDNGSTDTSSYVLDFFDFVPDMDSDPSIFETPEGMVCAGRVNTKDMPAFQTHFFHFQEEMVDIYYGRITHAEVWYDLDRKLVRVDYRSPSPEPPLYTTDPVSIIQDFGYGVSYMKDVASGDCTPMALTTNNFDGWLNTAALRSNGSSVISMKTPSSFFFLDSNFTYNGQRFARSALCDVYISHRDDLDVYNNGSAIEATVEVYFLASGWNQMSEQFPIIVQVWIPKLSKNIMHNIFDFDTAGADISVFDVTDCFNDSASLAIRVRFSGPYERDREHEVLLNAQNNLAIVMKVSPLRVNHLQLQYDASYVYVIATLLDRTPSLAQFTHLPKAVPEKNDDVSWSKVDSDVACSDLCVRNPDFTCLSFLYCPNERGGTCRISRQHVSHGNLSVVPGQCDLYSRTVNVVGPLEPTVREAYLSLKDAIAVNELLFQVILENEEEVDYMAVDAEILFGQLEQVTLPTVTGQFSYRVEEVFLRDNLVSVYDVWYDSVTQLVRVDRRDPAAGAPYYTPFTVSSIHDFNTGIAYDMDTTRGNCTVGPIPIQTFDGQAVNWTKALVTGRLTLALKTPQQILYLDNSYTFTGQKTVRGILCDVFESRRTDFSLGTGTQQSIFQYFFMSKNWQYEADTHDDITMQQPVQITVSDEQANTFIIYNFYDYNDEHTTHDKFNIAPCFTANQRTDFVLDFNQTYHPYLDSGEWRFKEGLLLTLSSKLRVSPLRLQNVRVSYNLDQTYVMITLLEQATPKLHFIEVGTSSPYNTHIVTPDSSVEGCASSCFNSRDIICNSFDLCPSSCYLSSRHVPDENVKQPNVRCRHFSRLTNGTMPEPSIDEAMISLKDMVYKGLITVILTTDSGDKEVSYTATGVRDDLFQMNATAETGAAVLRSKFWLFKTGALMGDSPFLKPLMAVDDCASQCWHHDQYTCNGFTYCYSTGNCLLSASRPGLNPDLLSPEPLCDVYSRFYLDDYTQYVGQAMEVADIENVHGILQPEDCARHCSMATGFICRSFDFCPTTKHCLLYPKHELDYSVALSNSSLCSHFSRNYLADFTLQVGKSVTTGYADLAISDAVSAQTCALRCAQEVMCRSFEFCTGECRLSSQLPSPDKFTNSSTCDFYTLTASATASVSRSTRTATSAAATVSRITSGPSYDTRPTTSAEGCSNKQTVSCNSDDTGVRVGLGVGMLVLGLFVGAALLLLVQKLLGKRNTEDHMELVPKMN